MHWSTWAPAAGLLTGDPDSAAQLVAGVLAGESRASDRLQATYASFLAFDARFQESLATGSRTWRIRPPIQRAGRSPRWVLWARTSGSARDG